MPVLAKFFTNAKLFGSDFSTEAIRRCKEGFLTQVSFLLASFEELTGDYDIVFSSATLEHFTDYKEKARALLRHGKYLCILVPYCERRFGKDLEYDLKSDHVVTFREDSFEFLLNEGLAKSIFPPKVFYVPRAGVRTFRSLVIEPVKDIVRLFLKRTLAKKTKMILYEIERA